MQLLSFSSQSSISNILLLYYSSACLLVHCLLQAVQDDDEFSETKEEDSGLRVFINNKDPSTSESTRGKSLVPGENDYRENVCALEESMTGWSCAKDDCVEKALPSSRNQETMDVNEKRRSKNESTPSTSKQGMDPNWKTQVRKRHDTCSGPLVTSSMRSNSFSARGRSSDRSEGESQLATEKNKHDVRKAPNFSGPLMLPNRASGNSLSAPIRSSGGYGDSLEDKSKGNVVKIRGRFSVTSENVDLVKDIPICSVPRGASQGPSLRKSASVGDWLVQSKQLHTNHFTKETINNPGPVSIIMPRLQNILQQTCFQQDLIMNLLNSLQQNELNALQSGMPPQTRTAENDMVGTTTERERLLLVRVAELQTRMTSLTDELIAERLKHNQLQEQLNAVYHQDDGEDRCSFGN